MTLAWLGDPPLEEGAFKACCASIYESPILSYLVGPALRPGGTRLTEEIAGRAGLDSASLVLDLASGVGETARFLASRFGCVVAGLDLSVRNLSLATRRPVELPRFACPPSFVAGDAESLPFASGSFDAVFCECALCMFPHKAAALSEVARVLRPGGILALADVTLEIEDLPPALRGIWGRVACLADALPAHGNARLLKAAGFAVEVAEDCRPAAKESLRGIDHRLLLARIGQAVGKFGLEDVDIKEARALLREAISLVDVGKLSYAYFIARRGK